MGNAPKQLHVGGNPPRCHGANVPVASGRRDTCAAPWRTPPPQPGRRRRHLKHSHCGERGLSDGKSGHRSVVRRGRTHHTPNRGTTGAPLARDRRTPTHRDTHGRSPARVDEQVSTCMYHPAQKTAKALAHQPQPTAGPHHGRIPHPNSAPQPGSGPTRAHSTRCSRSPENHHVQPPTRRAQPPRSQAKKPHPIVATPRARRGPPTTSRQNWPRPGPHSNCPRRRHHGRASWGATPIGTLHHQRDGGTPQSSILTLQGTPHPSTPTRP